MAMVFQSYAHLSAHDRAREHGVPAQDRRRSPKDEIAKRVDEAAELLELTELLDRKPAQPLGRPAPAGRDGPRHRARARRAS